MPAPNKILVVDDEPHMRAYIGALLRDLLTAVDIVEAGDEATALAQFAAQRPDLVMLDINLIGSSGLNVLKKIRAQDADVTIVMLTAVGIHQVVDEAMANGADGYILKECSYEEMAADLREVLVFENDDGKMPRPP
jgi:DNA-binding response OmpR family regulator